MWSPGAIRDEPIFGKTKGGPYWLSLLRIRQVALHPTLKSLVFGLLASLGGFATFLGSIYGGPIFPLVFIMTIPALATAAWV